MNATKPVNAVEELPVATTDASIEQEIVAKGLTAPRVTTADIESNIVAEHYFSAADGFYAANEFEYPLDDADPLHLLTFCVLVLRNGFTVTGESACASPENFDSDIGFKIARQNAVQKIWPLMGYALKERLFNLDKMRAKAGLLKTIPI